MDSVALQLVLPFYEPLDTSDEAIDALVAQVLAPTIARIGAVHGARIGLHFGGHLLDHLSRRHETLLLDVKQLAKQGQVEILGGMFYGGVPALMAELDVRGQVEMMSEYWESLTGASPEGLWLPRTRWTGELVRLVDESGLRYGYVGSDQLTDAAAPAPSLGTLARGGLRMPLFVVDTELSQALGTTEPRDWVEMLLAAAAGRELVTVHFHTNAWRTDASAQASLAEGGAFELLLRELDGSREEVHSVLPSHAFTLARPAAHLAIEEPQVSPTSLAARMQRTSDKLREAIAMMEEEALEESWSDGLATAQRLVFAAQAPDAYLPAAGDAARVRRAQEASLARLIEAERMIDALMQGPDAWLTVEEEDRDGDLVEELVLGNPRLAVTVVPARDGAVTSLDDRVRGKALFHVGPQHDRLRTWVLEAGTTSEEFFAGGAVDLATSSSAAEIVERRDDEEAGAFAITVHQELDLAGGTGRSLRIDKGYWLPVEDAEVRLTLRIEARGEPSVLVATEIPISLGAGLPRLWVDGNEVTLASRGVVSASAVRLVGDGGHGVELDLSPAQELWIGGVVGAEETGVVLVPVLKLDEASAAELTLRLP